MRQREKIAVLYISYDGALEPLGQSQIISYLNRLSSSVTFHLLTFEKKIDLEDTKAKEHCMANLKEAGIYWYPQIYHKAPTVLATSWDILIGVYKGLQIAYLHRIKIIHARSYVAAVVAFIIKEISSAKFVFDMRGFWADERVDGGLWRPNKYLYRVAKSFERIFFRRADHIVSLTRSAAIQIQRFPYLQGKVPPITVIPTCVDLDKFTPSKAQNDNFVFGWVGSVDTWYDFDAAVSCFTYLLTLRPDASFLIINRGQHAFIQKRLLSSGVPLSLVKVRAASFDEVPSLMRGISAGVFFYKQSFSRCATSPTKLAEFLACGIPVLSNQGVGDVTELFTKNKVGISVSNFSLKSLQHGVDRLLSLCEESDIAVRCRLCAECDFSVDAGAEGYLKAYKSLLNTF